MQAVLDADLEPTVGVGGPGVLDGFGGFASLFALDVNRWLFSGGYRKPVLVTCTDWDGRVYQSNIIVFAQPVRDAVVASTGSARDRLTAPRLFSTTDRNLASLAFRAAAARSFSVCA